MTTEDDFQNHLDAHPDDHLTRLVFADFLQDRDDPRAEGYRAMGCVRRRPQLENFTYRWYDDDSYPPDCTDPASNIPKKWFDAMSGGETYPDGANFFWVRIWPTRRAAEDAAALAFAKLPEDRRRALLAGKVVAA